MFNPFVRFIPELIDAFRKRGERYLVSQMFKAGVDVFSEEKDVLMFCHYNDLNYARVHLQAIKADRFAAIIDLENKKHLDKVKEMLEPDSRYLVFSNLIRDQRSVEEVAEKQYAPKLRRYIDRHTTWRIPTNGGIKPKLQLIFGELFIVVRFQSQHLWIKFEEIENL